MSETDLAYCAGLIDGEGYIGIKRSERHPGRVTPGFHARIVVRMVNREGIDFLAQTFGGQVRPHASSIERGRPLVSWNVTDALAERVLSEILPYLRVKRDQAENALALRAIQATSRQHRTKVVGYRNFPNAFGAARRVETRTLSDDYIARCAALHERGKELNARGL